MRNSVVAPGGVRPLTPTPVLRRALASPYLSLVFVTLIWGALHPVGKLAMREITPVQLILVRVLLAAITLTIILAIQGKAGAIVGEIRARPGTIALLGLCSFFASSGASMIALSMLPASVSSLLSNVSPLFVAIGVIATAHQRIRIAAIAGVLIGFVGLGVVVFGENPAGFGTLALSPFGVTLSLFGSLTWAIYIGLSSHALTRGNALAIVVASSLFGGIPWIVISLATGDLVRLFSVSSMTWGLLLYMGVMGTGVTYGLWTSALARLSAANVAVFQYAIPFWAVVLSVLVLGEQVTVPLVLGGIGIIVGIAITQSSARDRSRQPASD